MHERYIVVVVVYFCIGLISCALQCVTGKRCAVNAMIAAILYLLPIQESETELAGFWFSFFQDEYVYHFEKGKFVDYATCMICEYRACRYRDCR